MVDSRHQNETLVLGAQRRHDMHEQAEEMVRTGMHENPESLSPGETRRLVHDLRVHEIELAMQNEELRRSQVAVEALRARYFDLYDRAPTGYATLGARGLILEANLRASSMLGVQRGSLVNQPITRFIVAGDQDTYYRHQKNLLETRERQVCELRMKRPDDSELWTRLEGSVAPGLDGDAPTFRTTMSDITETRTLQVKLAQADRMASMGMLAAGVAHEINNPLTYLLYNVDELAKDLAWLTEAAEAAADEDAGFHLVHHGGRLDAVDLAKMRDRAQDSATGAQRIREITQRLSGFSRDQHTEVSLVDLNSVAQEAVRMAAHEVEARAVMVTDFGEIPPILGSPGKLVQVLLNLVVNAAQSIEEGRGDDHRVTVRTWSDAGGVSVEVQDTGCGISRKDQDLIFEPFFTTKGADRGTGLGLAIVQRTLADLGGGIRCESVLGKGTRFVVRFPSAHGERGPTTAQETPEPIARGRILVVDDEVMILEVVESVLEDTQEVVTAASGQEARGILERDTRFDLILCDLMMPGISGVDLHVWLRERHPKLAQRLVFLTGGAFTSHTQQYLAEVQNLVVDKPFTGSQLNEIVREHLTDKHPR